MSYKININPTTNSKISTLDFKHIAFGEVFTDHMFICDFQNGEWHNPRIEAFGKISISPTLSAFHYGQAIFEGMKAYKTPEGIVTMFRPEENLKRLNKSALRMAMPELPLDLFMEALKLFLDLDKEWIPTTDGGSLYLRPFMFATDDFLGVKSSDNYTFMIYACPVNAYYANHIKLKVEEHYTRAAQGGVGSAKCAGNYAASLFPRNLAQEEGYHQLLWTDGATHQFIEETGTSNVFIVTKNGVITPELTDSLLDGITRKSIIQIMKDMGIEVEQKHISVSELKIICQNKDLVEMFVTGTAATVTNVDALGFKDQRFDFVVEPNMLGARIKKYLEDLKTLKIEDKNNWVQKLEPQSVTTV